MTDPAVLSHTLRTVCAWRSARAIPATASRPAMCACTRTSEVSWTQVGADIDGEAAGDAAGIASLSADGTRVAIGAPRNNNANGTDAGHVRVFDEIGGVWTQVGADIDGEGTTDWCGQGTSLSADGMRVALGAQLNDGSGSQAGHVRVFTDSAGVWVQVGADIKGGAPNATMGRKVVLSADGQRVATDVSGGVRVFGEVGGIWSQIGSDLQPEGIYDDFGFATPSANGTRIGGPTMAMGSMQVHVRVFDESGGVWTQVGADIDGPVDSAWFGRSVALLADDSRVAIGATHGGDTTQNGEVSVYTEVNGAWVQTGPIIFGEAPNDYCGSAIALNTAGDRIAIGAQWNDGNGSNAGHVRVVRPGLRERGRGEREPAIFSAGAHARWGNAARAGGSEHRTIFRRPVHGCLTSAFRLVGRRRCNIAGAGRLRGRATHQQWRTEPLREGDPGVSPAPIPDRSNIRHTDAYCSFRLTRQPTGRWPSPRTPLTACPSPLRRAS